MIDKELLTSYKHILFYAKGHYKQTDVLSDLRILIGDRCGLTADSITDFGVYDVMTDILAHSIGPDALSRWFSSLFRPCVLGTFDSVVNVTKLDIIKRILTHIRFISVNDSNGDPIIDMGEPDYSILRAKYCEDESLFDSKEK